MHQLRSIFRFFGAVLILSFFTSLATAHYCSVGYPPLGSSANVTFFWLQQPPGKDKVVWIERSFKSFLSRQDPFATEQELTYFPNRFTFSIPAKRKVNFHEKSGKNLSVSTSHVFPVSQRFFNRQPVPYVDTSLSAENSAAVSTKTIRSRTESSKSTAANLTFSGSKSFAIQLGQQDNMSLSQALTLTITGTVTPQSHLALVLSDRGSPGSFNQSSKKLAEIDEVKAQFAAPHFSAQLGDFYWRSQLGSLFWASSTLQGIQGVVSDSQQNLTVTIASSKGQWQRKSFYGISGKQGPYVLNGTTGSYGATIVSGTERVYLDGELLQSGSNKDYQIDYAGGTVTFSPRRPVRADSRIAVEFESSDQEFSRTFWAGQSQTSFWGGRGKLAMSFVRVADDRSTPLKLSLSEQDRQIIGEKGGDSLRAAKNGAVYVGPKGGDYVIDFDSSGNDYYRYIGKDSGDYRVTFSLVSPGRGDYRYAGLGAYRYAGKNQGDFAPIIYLPIPQSRSLFGSVVSFSPRSDFKVDAEWALSRYDRNLFSAAPGRLAFAQATRLVFGWNSINGHQKGWNISGNLHLRERQFNPLADWSAHEQESSWGISRPIRGDERAGSLSGQWGASNLQVGLQIGFLNQARIFSARRASSAVAWQPFSKIRFHLQDEEVRSSAPLSDTFLSERLFYRHRFSTSGLYKGPVWQTEIGWSDETNWRLIGNPGGSPGERTQHIRGKVGWRNLYVVVGQRTNFTSGWQWRRYFRQTEITLGGAFTYPATGWSSDFVYSRHILFRYVPVVSRTHLDYLLWKSVWTPSDRLLQLDLHHSFNRVARRSFSSDLSDTLALYTAAQLNPGFNQVSDVIASYYDALAVPEFSQSLRLEFSPRSSRRFASPSGGLSDQLRIFFRHTDFLITVSNVQQWSHYPYFDLGLLALLRPDQNRRLFTDQRVNTESRWWFGNEKGFFFVRTWAIQQESERYESGSLARNNLLRSLGFRGALNRLYSIEVEIQQSRRKEKNSVGSLYDLWGRGVRINLSRVAGRNVNLSTEAKILSEHNTIMGVGTNLFFIAPQVDFRPAGSLRLIGQTRFYRVRLPSGSNGLPFIQAEGKPPGNSLDWSFTGEWRGLNKMLGLLSLSGRTDRWFGYQTIGRMEVKAYF